MVQLATQLFHLAASGCTYLVIAGLYTRSGLCGATHYVTQKTSEGLKRSLLQQLCSSSLSCILASSRSSQESELRKRNIVVPPPPPEQTEPARSSQGNPRTDLRGSSQTPAAARGREPGEARGSGAAKGRSSCAGGLDPSTSQRVPVHGTGSQCLCLLSSLFPMMSVPPPFCFPSPSLHWEKWTALANQPALTLGLLCEWEDCLDFSRFRFTRFVFVRMQCEGSAPPHPTKPSVSVVMDAQGLSSSGVAC